MGFGSLLPASVRYDTAYGIGTGIGTYCNSSSSSTTQGAWVSLGVTSFDYDGFMFTVAASKGDHYRIDIGIQVATTQEVLVGDLFISYPPDLQAWRTQATVQIPIFVPTGSTLYVRNMNQDGDSSQQLNVQITGYQGDSNLLKGCSRGVSFTDWGSGTCTPANLVTATGTSFTAWTTICASSPNRCVALLAGFYPSNNENNINGLAQIGWGAAASERVLFPLILNGNEYNGIVIAGPLPCDFPAGTRFAVRFQMSAASTTSNLGMSLVGLVP